MSAFDPFLGPSWLFPQLPHSHVHDDNYHYYLSRELLLLGLPRVAVLGLTTAKILRKSSLLLLVLLSVICRGSRVSLMSTGPLR